jgi:hypothetical protein
VDELRVGFLDFVEEPNTAGRLPVRLLESTGITGPTPEKFADPIQCLELGAVESDEVIRTEDEIGDVLGGFRFPHAGRPREQEASGAPTRGHPAQFEPLDGAAEAFEDFILAEDTGGQILVEAAQSGDAWGRGLGGSFGHGGTAGEPGACIESARLTSGVSWQALPSAPWTEGRPLRKTIQHPCWRHE